MMIVLLILLYISPLAVGQGMYYAMNRHELYIALTVLHLLKFGWFTIFVGGVHSSEYTHEHYSGYTSIVGCNFLVDASFLIL